MFCSPNFLGLRYGCYIPSLLFCFVAGFLCLLFFAIFQVCYFVMLLAYFVYFLCFCYFAILLKRSLAVLTLRLLFSKFAILLLFFVFLFFDSFASFVLFRSAYVTVATFLCCYFAISLFCYFVILLFSVKTQQNTKKHSKCNIKRT